MEGYIETSFATELRAAMEEAGITASQLAQRSGLTEAAISYLRSGRRSPSYKTVQRLTAVLPSLASRLEAESRITDTIEEAIAEIRAGRMVIVLDDEDRENEGDLVMAAQMVTPEAINFMRKEGGGLICVPIIGKRLDELQIPSMVDENTSLHETAFTVSVEARGRTTTGISAYDRAATIQALLDPHAKPSDFLRPGHTFPLRARDGGVIVRAGQTEAAVDLARLAGFYPAGVICEIMDDDALAAAARVRRKTPAQAHHREGSDRLPDATREARRAGRGVQPPDGLRLLQRLRLRVQGRRDHACRDGDGRDRRREQSPGTRPFGMSDRRRAALDSLRLCGSARRRARTDRQRKARGLPVLASGRPRYRTC